MRRILRLACTSASLFALAAAGAAPAPVALVEDVQGKVAGVEFMDYVAAGKVIKLGATDALVLSYLKSCWRETITGGIVTIGEEQSTVRLGKVERAKVACNSNRMQLSTREATQSAATVFRSMRREPPAARSEPVTLYGQSPVVEVNEARGRLVIERLDDTADRIELEIAGPALLRGKFFDLAKTPVVLKPGAAYALSLGTQKVEFRIAPEAAPGAAPLVGRLLRLE
jgi:hypothetical protein